MGVLNTRDFYRESCAAGYVKLDAVARNEKWTSATAWGDIEITINLSKPEKDPRAIARAAGGAPAADDYVDPATGRTRSCPLCVCQADLDCGYARKLDVCGEPWGLWYSPYAYYGEHCIAMSWQHRPMHVDRASFECLFAMVDLLPHYFFGSNADLPIVGGSILAHDHFQGGCHVFPLQEAPLASAFALPAFPGVRAGIVKWPVSVVRLEGESQADLVDAACHVLDVWCAYDDERAGIVSGVDGAAPEASETRGRGRIVRALSERPMPGRGTCSEADATFMSSRSSEARESARVRLLTRSPDRPGDDCAATRAYVSSFSGGRSKGHNTVTPMLRTIGGVYQLDLALRCNVTSEAHPLGVFHPHEELHHIKRENIGLIEVMGLAILPPRVQGVMVDQGLSHDDVGYLFARVLECAGVFKWDEQGRAACARFVDALGAAPISASRGEGGMR